MDTYVYGVLRAGGSGPPPGEGVDGEKVALVERGELAALVSDAPSAPVRGTRRNLLAHSQVLQEVVRERCVLPMRFGVVMPGRGVVARELLEEHAERLVEQLETFDPFVELELRALCREEALLRSVLAERPEIAAARERLAGRSPDATYYERIRLGELVAQAVGEKREAITRMIAATLEPLAAGSEVGDPLHDEMLANVAFLIERRAIDRFDEAVGGLGSELGPEVRLRYIGPLPPHSFVDISAETEARAWA